MTELYMLDTNMVSYIVKGRSPAARARLLALKDNEIACASSVTEGEIRYGLARKPEAIALRTLMDGLLASIQVLPWGRSEADAYGRVRCELEKNGLTLGNMDMMIAAHAVATDAVLITREKAFAQVRDIRAFINWTTDF